MKKIYMTPALQATEMAECLPIAVSNPKVTVDTEGSVDANDLDVKGGEWDNIWE